MGKGREVGIKVALLMVADEKRISPLCYFMLFLCMFLRVLPLWSKLKYIHIWLSACIEDSDVGLAYPTEQFPKRLISPNIDGWFSGWRDTSMAWHYLDFRVCIISGNTRRHRKKTDVLQWSRRVLRRIFGAPELEEEIVPWQRGRLCDHGWKKVIRCRNWMQY